MRLATFNVMHGRSLRDGRIDAARFRAAVAQIDVDVLALQEVDRDQPRSHGIDLAHEAAAVMGGDYQFAPALFGTPGQRWRGPGDGTPVEGEPQYGVALVSRLPVRTWSSWHLPAAPVRSPVILPRLGARPRVAMMRDEPRVVLAARVESPAGPLTVATTHLSFVPGWNVVQTSRVCAWLRGLPGPRVLAGDLNLPGGLPSAVCGWRRLARLVTYPAHRPRLQIDHVLADRTGGTPAVRGAYTVGTAVSDHLALVIEFDDVAASS